MPEDSFRRWAGIGALVAAAGALIDIIFSIIAANGQFNIGSHLMALLTSGPTHATEMRVAWVADIIAYLAMTPLVLYLGWLARRRWPEMGLVLMVAGLMYVVIGSIGAATLAVVVPHLMRDYVTAPVAQHPAMRVVFSTLYQVVVDGLWDVLETIPGGVFWVGIGIFLLRANRALGTGTIVLGVIALLSSLGNMLELGFVTKSGVGEFWALIGTIWLIWVGLDLLFSPAQWRES